MVWTSELRQRGSRGNCWAWSRRRAREADGTRRPAPDELRAAEVSSRSATGDVCRPIGSGRARSTHSELGKVQRPFTSPRVNPRECPHRSDTSPPAGPRLAMRSLQAAVLLSPLLGEVGGGSGAVGGRTPGLPRRGVRRRGRPVRLLSSTASRTARRARRASPCSRCRCRSRPAIGVRFTGGPCVPGAEPTRSPAASQPPAPPPRPQRRGRCLTASQAPRPQPSRSAASTASRCSAAIRESEPRRHPRHPSHCSAFCTGAGLFSASAINSSNSSRRSGANRDTSDRSTTRARYPT